MLLAGIYLISYPTAGGGVAYEALKVEVEWVIDVVYSLLLSWRKPCMSKKDGVIEN